MARPASTPHAGRRSDGVTGLAAWRTAVRLGTTRDDEAEARRWSGLVNDPAGATRWLRHGFPSAEATRWLAAGWTVDEAALLLRHLGLVSWRDLRGGASDERIDPWLSLGLAPWLTALAVRAGVGLVDAATLRPGDRSGLETLAGLRAG